MKYIYLLSLAILFSCNKKSSTNSSSVSVGHIKMAVTDFSSSIPGSDNMKGLIDGISHDIYFTPDKQVTEMKMMNGMELKIFFEGTEVNQYMDVSGQKILVKMNTDEWKQYGVTQEQLDNETTITYDTNDRLNIEGYDCYKAIINMTLPKVEGLPDTTPAIKMEAYITDEIKLAQSGLQQLKGLELQGTPLMITMDMDIMKMTYKAISVNTDYDISKLEKPQGAYREISVEELSKSGSMGMGF